MNTTHSKHPLLALLFSLFLCISFSSKAQTENTTIKIAYSNSGITLNGITITDKTTFKEVEKTIGKSSRKQKFTKQAHAYIYDQSGLIFYTEKGYIQSIGITLDSTSEDGGPTSPFAGIFEVNNVVISKHTPKDVLGNIPNLDMYCPGDQFCTLNIIDTQVNCLLNYNGENNLSFINLSFKLIIR